MAAGMRNHMMAVQSGNILFISMLLLLVMSLMGIALISTSKRESQLVISKTSKSGSFYAADTCIEDAKRWLLLASSGGEAPAVSSGQASSTACTWTVAAMTLPCTITATIQKRALTDTAGAPVGYDYSCIITQLTVAGTGTGADVGTSGSAGSDRYYQIDSTATDSVTTTQSRVIAIVLLSF